MKEETVSRICRAMVPLVPQRKLKPGIRRSCAHPESVTKQTQEVLSIIDGHLAKAGSDKSKLLSATIYLPDMKTFPEMNAVWDGWVSAGNTPARATVEAGLAAPQYGVEIMVIAAR
jgi:enamine deaminase RidA (YjgF/YER057c/UK114 family)